MNLDILPEDCFAHILSLTSPRDACRSSLVSSSLQAQADSDAVWRKFLPSDYQDILSRLSSPLVCSSYKELFFMLCTPCLIDGGNKSFSIERSTRKKCYMLSARELSITWATHPLYWSWKPLADSRFAEVAELITVWWLEIHGSISSKVLSPATVYSAYLVVKFADRAFGLDFLPSEALVEVGSLRTQVNVFLSPLEERKKSLVQSRFLSRAVESTLRPWKLRVGGAIREREDGWVEIELGTFFNDGSKDENVNFSLAEVKGQHLKGGLIVEGIELRPKTHFMSK